MKRATARFSFARSTTGVLRRVRRVRNTIRTLLCVRTWPLCRVVALCASAREEKMADARACVGHAT